MTRAAPLARTNQAFLKKTLLPLQRGRPKAEVELE